MVLSTVMITPVMNQGHAEHIIDTSGQRVGLHEAGVSQNFDKQGNGIETG